jgi:long-subunit acyl-CoA synthetase (AMP-forming)
MQRYYAQADELALEPTLAKIFALSCRKPDNIYALWPEGGQILSMTYGEMERKVAAAAAALAELALPQLSCVGLKLKNCPEWGVIFWAILAAGYCPLLMDAAANTAYDSQVIADSGAVLLIAESDPQAAIPWVNPRQLLAHASVDCGREWADEVMFSTSGTTGERTIQVFDGRNFQAQIESARLMPNYNNDIMYPDEAGPLRNLALLPLHHSFGFIAVFLWFTFFQKTIVYPLSVSPGHIRELARRTQVTHIFCVPLLWNGIAAFIRYQARHGARLQALLLRRILKIAAIADIPTYCAQQQKLPRLLLRQVQKRIFGNSVRFLISGGSFINCETLRLINALGYPLYNGFGLTEAGITSVELDPSLAMRVSGGIGVPLSNVEYQEEGGTLWIRSPQLARGEMRAGQFVPAAYRDGWLDSGDLVRLQYGATAADSRYHICGRLKDLIITAAGENIAPDLIEAELGYIAGIKRYCVLGLPDQRHEEVVCLLLETEQEPDRDLWQNLRRQIAAANCKLPAYMRIKRILLAQQPLYLTNTMKVRRAALQQDIKNQLFPIMEIKLADTGHQLLQPIPEPLPCAIRE